MTTSEQNYCYSLMYYLKMTFQEAEKESKRWHSKAHKGLIEPKLVPHSLSVKITEYITSDSKIINHRFLKPTNLFDMKGLPIHVEDKLRSIYNYDVIVKEAENGVFYGQLVCDENHPYKDIPYALNNGLDFFIIEK
jgi:hypothetical protein